MEHESTGHPGNGSFSGASGSLSAADAGRSRKCPCEQLVVASYAREL